MHKSGDENTAFKFGASGSLCEIVGNGNIMENVEMFKSELNLLLFSRNGEQYKLRLDRYESVC